MKPKQVMIKYRDRTQDRGCWPGDATSRMLGDVGDAGEVELRQGRQGMPGKPRDAREAKAHREPDAWVWMPARDRTLAGDQNPETGCWGCKLQIAKYFTIS